MQRFKGVASGKQSFREHCATKWFLEANPRNISASKISRYMVSKKQAEPISPDEEAVLWAQGIFGTHNAQIPTNTVYFYNCKVFALQSYEHRNLKRDQFTKKVDEKSRVYMQYTDYGNKSNRGGLKHIKVDPIKSSGNMKIHAIQSIVLLIYL